MSASKELDVRVLGQLLVMQSVVTSLPDGVILDFILEGLTDIPGIRRVTFTAETITSHSSLGRFPLMAGRGSHGSLLFEVAEPHLFAPYTEPLRNFAFMLAVILEERQQRKAIENHHTYLEQEVALRTAELARERDTAQSYLDIARVMLMALDHQGNIMMINRKGSELLARPAHELLGMNWFDHFVPPDERPHMRQLFSRLMAGEYPIVEHYESRVVIADGTELTVSWSSSLLYSEAGDIIGILASAEDITHRKQTEARIRELAYYDQITGLPNRTLLLERLHKAIASCDVNGAHGALLIIDLDNFKTLNDTLGHDAGDTLLRLVANRLGDCIREGDTLARLGGDEFMVILEGLSQDRSEAQGEAEAITEHILATLNHTYQLGQAAQHSAASIGVTLFDGACSNTDELLKQADLAMYKSKSAGRNIFKFFDPALESVVRQRAELEGDLRQAIAEDQLVLHYQPIVTGDKKLIGVEALLRWRHPQRGLVPPADFIPLAEETGLIQPLGLWVLKAACEQLAAWANEPGRAQLRIAVNVSARQFRQPDIVDQFLRVITNSRADPRLLKLELTESLLVDNIKDVIGKMFALKASGIGFSLDDFGTGYSSLSYLSRLPIDELKIDRSFVNDVLIDPDDAAIAKTIIALARSLGMVVIAEGVETALQRDLLVDFGCHVFQGYLFSRPLPIDQFESFARELE